MLQFRKTVDRKSKFFIFEGIPPNAQPDGVGTDLCGEGFNKNRIQQSIDRGMFYVMADKKSTARDNKGMPCRAGNYEPAWTEGRATYQVKATWLDALWKQYKLCLLYTSPSPRDATLSRMPSSA